MSRCATGLATAATAAMGAGGWGDKETERQRRRSWFAPSVDNASPERSGKVEKEGRPACEGM